MGKPLTPADVARYREALELEKAAAIGRIVPWLRKGFGAGMKATREAPRGLITGMQTAAERAIHPVKGIRAGWKGMSPSENLARAAQKARETATKQGLSPEKVEEAVRAAQQQWGAGILGTRLGRAGRHFAEPTGPGASRARRFFEEASRRGWTGRGDIGKYLPIGQKGMLAGFAATGIPEVVQATEQPPSPVSEGGALSSALGQLGGLGGYIAGGGLGLLPGLALWYGGERLGKGVGRVAERLRGGASLPTAVQAPAPSEAAEQLARIQRYYG